MNIKYELTLCDIEEADEEEMNELKTQVEQAIDHAILNLNTLLDFEYYTIEEV